MQKLINHWPNVNFDDLVYTSEKVATAVTTFHKFVVIRLRDWNSVDVQYEKSPRDQWPVKEAKQATTPTQDHIVRTLQQRLEGDDPQPLIFSYFAVQIYFEKDEMHVVVKKCVEYLAQAKEAYEKALSPPILPPLPAYTTRGPAPPPPGARGPGALPSSPSPGTRNPQQKAPQPATCTSQAHFNLLPNLDGKPAINVLMETWIKPKDALAAHLNSLKVDK